jgi:hypothetical protein
MSKVSPFNYSSNPDIAAIEAEIALKAPINNPVFTGTVTLPGNPASDLQAATKAYVDAGLQGLSPKPTPVVATTTTLPAYTYANGSSGVGATITMTATGVVAIDGRNLILNDRILVKDEGAGVSPYNGLYDVTTAGAVGVALVLTRNTSMDKSTEFAGAYLLVDSGSTNAGAGYWCTNTTNPTVGVTNIVFAQFNAASSISVGTGLQKIGSTLSIDSTVATLTGSQALTNKTVNGLTNTALATGFTIAGGTTSKTLTVALDASVSGTNTGDQTTVSGNAGTATALQNARTIGGVSFDATANIVPQTIQTVDETVDTTCFVLLGNSSGSQTSGQQPKTNSGLTYNAAINNLGATTFTGALSGNATTATTLATTRTIYGNNFNGSADLNQIIASNYGGTGNGFTKFSGPATAEKTFTLPNTSATILTDNAAVTVAQGGTGRASTTAYAVICGGTTSTGAEQSISSVGTAGQFLKSAGSGALPFFASFVAPTIQKFTSGSGTYITPANVIYIRVRQAGGGGGGGGSGTASQTAGGAGGNSIFGSSLLMANGGGGGGVIGGGGGAGGTVTLSAPAIGTALIGGGGQGHGYNNSVANGTSLLGGSGGNNAFGGGGGGAVYGAAGVAGATNTGGGGGGGGTTTGVTSSYSGSGGGAGGFIDAIITSPSATYSYAVGAAGAAGAAGINGFAGGAGGSGYIEVTEYYQ